jgi:hypothetical protein
MKIMSMVALISALIALGLAIENRLSAEQRVRQIVEQRETAYCERIVKKMNEGRVLMGIPPANAKNFAEVLEAYFESMASVMDQAVTNPAPVKNAK